MRRTRIQGYRRLGTEGTISWEEHEAIWAKYHEHHKEQDAERIAERGGFGYEEATKLLGHEPETFEATHA